MRCVQGCGDDKVQWTGWNIVIMSKSLLNSLDPTVFEILLLVIKGLMSMHRDSSEIGQNNAS